MKFAFSDHRDNFSDALISILAKEARMIEGLSGAILDQVQQSLITLIGGIVTEFSFN